MSSPAAPPPLQAPGGALSIYDAAEEAGEALALWTPERRYSFAELAERTRAHPAPAGEAFVAAPGLDSLLTLLKGLAEGRRRCPLHPKLPAAQQQALRERLATAGPGEGDEALVLFTSGSAGQPKGVALSRGALVAAAQASAAALGWRPDDRWLLSIPLAHVGGLSILTRCLIARRAVVLAPPGPFDPQATAARLREAEVSLVSFVPTQLRRLLRTGWAPPPALRALILGGAPATPALLAAAAARGAPVLTTYGLTESCAQVCLQRPGSPPSPREGAGRPLPGVQLRVVDGRIQLRGPSLLSRYLPLGGAPPPPCRTADGWFHTGDQGHLDADGRLFVRGRAGEMILSGGENVYPAEVEPALLADPAVAEALVFGEPDPDWGQRVCAAVCWAGAPDPAGLQARLHDQLAPHQRPRRLLSLAALPKTPSGKLDRAAARRLASQRPDPS